jgi:hypothetical protein
LPIRCPYFGGVFESGGGAVLPGLAAPFGLVLDGDELSGGMVVVVPGAVDWSAGGGDVVVSAGGELAEPAGEVDSCLEQAANSASEPTHNNRTLRFIRSPHYCNDTVTRVLRGPQRSWKSRKRRSSVAAFAKATPMPRACVAAPWYPWGFMAGARA